MSNKDNYFVGVTYFENTNGKTELKDVALIEFRENHTMVRTLYDADVSCLQICRYVFGNVTKDSFMNACPDIENYNTILGGVGLGVAPIRAKYAIRAALSTDRVVGEVDVTIHSMVQAIIATRRKWNIYKGLLRMLTPYTTKENHDKLVELADVIKSVFSATVFPEKEAAVWISIEPTIYGSDLDEIDYAFVCGQIDSLK